MSLKNLDKHGLLVAVVTVLATLIVFHSEASMLRYFIGGDYDIDMSILFILKHVGTFALALLGVLTATLMTWGIIKRHHTLILPWIVLYCLAAILCTIAICYDMFSRNQQFDDIMFGLCVIGFEIIVVYPIYILYADIRMENMQLAAENDVSSYRKNFQDDFGEYFQRNVL